VQLGLDQSNWRCRLPPMPRTSLRFPARIDTVDRAPDVFEFKLTFRSVEAKPKQDAS
jgi:hypothetical protein